MLHKLALLPTEEQRILLNVDTNDGECKAIFELMCHDMLYNIYTYAIKKTLKVFRMLYFLRVERKVDIILCLSFYQIQFGF